MYHCLNSPRSQKSIRNVFFRPSAGGSECSKNETWIPLLQCPRYEIYSDALICVVYFVVPSGALCVVCCEINCFDQEFSIVPEE